MRWQLTGELQADSPAAVFTPLTFTPVFRASLTPAIGLRDGQDFSIIAVQWDLHMVVQNGGPGTLSVSDVEVTAGLYIDGGPYDQMVVALQDLDLTNIITPSAAVNATVEGVWSGTVVLPQAIELDAFENIGLQGKVTLSPSSASNDFPSAVAKSSSVQPATTVRLFGTSDNQGG